MEKIEIKETSLVPSQYKLEVTKNTKGYQWVAVVNGNDIETIKKDMLDLENWAKENYS